MPRRLRRYYGSGYAHFITTSCFRRLPLLNTPWRRDLLLKVLEQVRRRYGFVVLGYVVMPEHVHLLIGEPERGNPSTVMQAIKQGWARRMRTRQRSNSRQGELCHRELTISGNGGFMTSWCGPQRSGSRS